MSTDPVITDRRDEITHNHIPDGLADRRDSGGNIVLGEVRYGHRPVAPEPDELTPFLARTKVKPRDLPSYTGGDAVTYCAKVAGLPAIAKAAAREAKATAAWRDAEAQLRDARTKLRESCRGWRTDAAIEQLREVAVGEYVFGKADGTKTTRSGRPRYELRKVAEAAGVEGVGFHRFRHTHISMLALEGGNESAIAARAGHTDASFTKRRYIAPLDIAIAELQQTTARTR